MDKIEIEKSEETNTPPANGNTKCESKQQQIAEKAEEHPEWLPDRWDVDVRIRKSGVNIGSIYKCYTDPLKGYKFYSKPQVLRYLEIMKDGSCTTKKGKKCRDTRSPRHVCMSNSVVVEKEKEKEEDNSCISKEKKCTNTHTPNNVVVEKEKDDNSCASKKDPVVVEKSAVEDLPPGWIKELKVRKNSNGNKKDPFYTDPVSGYVFRSKKDVLRYLESGDIRRCAYRPNRRQIQDEDKSTPSPAAKRQKLKQSTPIQQLFVGKDVFDKSNLELSDANGSIKLQDVNMHKIQEVMNTSHNLSEDQSVFKEQAHLPETDKAEDNKPEIRTDSNKSSNKKVHHIPSRGSKRLAGVEHELMSNSISCDKAPEIKSKMTKDEVNAEVQKSEDGPAAELAVHASIKAESSNKRRKSLKIPPSTDDQLEKVEGEEMGDEKSKPQLSFAFHYACSDPSLESAINTLTGVLPPTKDSVDNGPSTVLETDIPKSPFDNVIGRRDRNPSLEFATNTLAGMLPAEDSVDNGPTAAVGTDTQKTSFDNVTGSRVRKSQVRSNKSKNKKELKAPMRLSKRLAGLEPEVRPSERAVEYVSRKSSKKEPTATATETNGASDQLDTGEETKPTPHASDRSNTEVLGESSNKSDKSYDVQTVPNEQLQKVKAENIGDERSEPQLESLFGDPWSDPCLDFAIKTLTGALPVDAAADILPVMSPDVNSLPNKEMHESVVMSINEEAHNNKNQSQNRKVLNMVSQSSKLLLGQPELRTVSTSCESAPTFTTRQSYSNEGNVTRSINGEPLHTEALNVTQLEHHSRNISTPIHDWPLKGNEKVLECESISMEQPPLETENYYNPESQFCASFMDSWSDDPCLEFAFKTLTGALPVEENLSLQGCFPDPANNHDQRDDGTTLPRFGSSSFCQSDISFYHDIGVESRPGQQSSMGSSVPPLEKQNLQGCPGVDTQKHYSQWNKNFQR